MFSVYNFNHFLSVQNKSVQHFQKCSEFTNVSKKFQKFSKCNKYIFFQVLTFSKMFNVFTILIIFNVFKIKNVQYNFQSVQNVLTFSNLTFKKNIQIKCFQNFHKCYNFLEF